LLLNLLALEACSIFPISDRPLVKAEGKDDSLARAAFGKQLDDDHKLILLVMEPVKRRAFVIFRKVLTTEFSLVPLIFKKLF